MKSKKSMDKFKNTLLKPKKSLAKKSFRGHLPDVSVYTRNLVKRQRNTLKIYKEWLGFKTPTRVLIDGSVLVHVIQNNIHLMDLFQHALQELNLKLYTTNCILQEVMCYLSKYSGLKDLNAFTEQLIVKCCGHTQQVSALDCMEFLVGEHNKYKFFVATNEKCFSDNPFVPVLSVDNGIFGIKYLANNEKRRALKLYSKYPLSEPAVMDDDSPLPYDHPESPEYKRLMARYYRATLGRISIATLDLLKTP